jgi:prolipoprotein diacylglyceryltransferase
MFTLGAYFHDLSPFLMEFSPGFGVRWYGLSYALGFLVAYLIFRFLCKRGYTQVPEQKLIDGLLLLIAMVIVGGRLGYVLIYDRAILTQVDNAFPYWGVFKLSQGVVDCEAEQEFGVACGGCCIARRDDWAGAGADCEFHQWRTAGEDCGDARAARAVVECEVSTGIGQRA